MDNKTQGLLTLASDIGSRLKAKGETIAVAESSSGGLISASLLSVPGASAYFLGGGIIYTKEARRVLLGLSEVEVNMRAATEEYAALIAETIRQRLGATWGLCETGASGPTGNAYGDSAGHTAMAIDGPKAKSTTLETGLTDREHNMFQFSKSALKFLKVCID